MTPLTLDSQSARDTSRHAQPGISPEPAPLCHQGSASTSVAQYLSGSDPHIAAKTPTNPPQSWPESSGIGGAGVSACVPAYGPPWQRATAGIYSRRGTSVPIPAVEFPPVETLRLINNLISLPNPLADPLNTLVTTTRPGRFSKRKR